MHYRFLVTFDIKHARKADDARDHVLEELYDEHFCCEGRWARGIADWLVIGGRWSGELSRCSWAREITAQMRAIEKEHDVQVWGVFYSDPEKQQLQQKLAIRFQEMWDATAPREYKRIPYQRDTWKQFGYEDDAMILTQEIYDRLLKQYEGVEDGEHHTDLDYQPVSPDMVGKKWVVVVDYHS